MSPWVPSHTPLDREAWKIFPANYMYFTMFAITMSIGFYTQMPW